MVRMGIGYDVHRLVDGRPLILGGVEIPSKRGLEGHSDADVVIHAIIDALLGAAALGDIGMHFPDTAEQWAGSDSRELLRTVRGLLSEKNYSINNVDATVALEQPRLSPHIDSMRTEIAAALGIDVDRVSVKATTSEKIGFVGRGEGAAAWATCAVEQHR